MTESQIVELLRNLLEQAKETEAASGNAPSAIEALSWAIDEITAHHSA
jgi:hypothetical protein